MKSGAVFDFQSGFFTFTYAQMPLEKIGIISCWNCIRKIVILKNTINENFTRKKKTKKT